MNVLRRQKAATPPADDVEDQIHRAVIAQFAQPDQRQRMDLAMPDYVQHDPDANEEAKLTAQVIAAQYEASATSLERMYAAIKECATKVDADVAAILRDRNAFNDYLDQLRAEIEEVAKQYRVRAATLFKEIQNASILAEDVRRTCSLLSQQIATGKPRAQDDGHDKSEGTNGAVADAGDDAGQGD